MSPFRLFIGKLTLFALFALSLPPLSVAAAHPENTAAAHGLVLPGDVAAKLPFLGEFTVGNNRKVLNTHFVNFTFATPWPQVLEFFSTGFVAHGWEIIREELPEQERGNRSAVWVVTGHGVDASLSLETFGGPEGQNSVGVLQVRPSR
ncbi:MAG: hypothetical protein EA399_04275 [Desulfovibrionales bacterium]|nr:MAG: hypothetical protein EA399_04275 [Desulfovibrionales bacterium]